MENAVEDGGRPGVGVPESQLDGHLDVQHAEGPVLDEVDDMGLSTVEERVHRDEKIQLAEERKQRREENDEHGGDVEEPRGIGRQSGKGLPNLPRVVS